MTPEGCLPICLLLLAHRKPSRKSELGLITNGFKNSRDYYSLGILQAFVSKYKCKLTIFVGNKYFYRVIKSEDKTNKLNFVHSSINEDFLINCQTPYILQLDHFYLSSKTHTPHFVIIENIAKNHFYVIDPWTGEMTQASKDKIIKAVQSLRKLIKFCPLVIKIK